MDLSLETKIGLCWRRTFKATNENSIFVEKELSPYAELIGVSGFCVSKIYSLGVSVVND